MKRYGEKGRIDDAYKRGLADGEKGSKEQLHQLERENAQLHTEIKNLQRALSEITGTYNAGVDDAKAYSRMAKFLLGGGYQRMKNSLTSAQQWLDGFLKDPVFPEES